MILLLTSTLGFSSNGQQNDSLQAIPSKNIIRGNATYVALTAKVSRLEGTIKNKEEENQRLTLAYNHRVKECEEYSAANLRMTYANNELRGIIKQKDVVIKIIGGVAATAIGYGIYKTFRTPNPKGNSATGYIRPYPNPHGVGYIY